MTDATATINGTPYPVPAATTPVIAYTPPGRATTTPVDYPDDTPATPGAAPGILARGWRTVHGDAAHWWIHTSRPAPLNALWRHRRLNRATRAPADNGLIRTAWAVDDWTTGLLFLGLGLGLYALAGGWWWVKDRPLRRWAALFIAAVTFAWVVWG